MVRIFFSRLGPRSESARLVRYSLSTTCTPIFFKKIRPNVRGGFFRDGESALAYLPFGPILLYSATSDNLGRLRRDASLSETRLSISVFRYVDTFRWADGR